LLGRRISGNVAILAQKEEKIVHYRCNEVVIGKLVETSQFGTHDGIFFLQVTATASLFYFASLYLRKNSVPHNLAIATRLKKMETLRRVHGRDKNRNHNQGIGLVVVAVTVETGDRGQGQWRPVAEARGDAW
jgi:hypothetical protein